MPPGRRTAHRAPHLAALFLIDQVDRTDSVLVAVGDRRPSRSERPPAEPYLRVWILERRYVGEGQIRGDLLLQSNARLRQVRRAGECRIDFQLADAEDALETIGHRVCDRLADNCRLAHLLKALLRLGWLVRQ